MELFAVRPRWELNSTLLRPSPSSSKVSPLTKNLGFSFPVPSPGWKVFLLTISIIFWFSSHISSLILEVFHRLIPLSGFPPQSPITGLGSFSPATSSLFETHQLPYRVRMFSLVPRFSSSVFLIGLGGFSSGFYSRFPFKVYSRFSFKVFIQGSLQSSLLTDSTLSRARI